MPEERIIERVAFVFAEIAVGGFWLVILAVSVVWVNRRVARLKRAVLVALVSGCTTASNIATPTPTVTTAAAVSSTSDGLVTTSHGGAPIDIPHLFATGNARELPVCPPTDEALREHCVWLKAVPGVSGGELAKRMNAAKFPVEVDGDKARSLPPGSLAAVEG